MPVTAWPVHGSRIIATSELSSYGAPPAVSLPAGNPARQGPTLLLCRRGKRGWERWTACLNYLCREQQGDAGPSSPHQEAPHEPCGMGLKMSWVMPILRGETDKTDRDAENCTSTFGKKELLTSLSGDTSIF